MVDLGVKRNKFGEDKVRIRIIWVLDKLDSEGKPFRVMREVNASIADKPKKSSLYEIVEGVFGRAPQVPFDDETLINRSNELTVVRETDPKTGKVYANIKAILPLPAGAVPPAIPQGFVRAKFRDRQPTSTLQNIAPQAQAQVQATVPANPVTAPTPAQAPAAAPTVATAPAVDAAF